MNKLIERLAKEAGLNAYYHGQEADIERFAKTVAKYCSLIALENCADNVAVDTTCFRINSQIIDAFK